MSLDRTDWPAYAVVLAGGSGTRFQAGMPKQLVRLAGQPILHHTLTRFDQPALFRKVVVPSNVLWRSTIEEIAERAIRNVEVEVVDGGQDRNSSVRNSLAAIEVEEAKVLIHDGVRPLVSLDLIERVLSELNVVRSVLPVIPSADLLAKLEGRRVVGFADRNHTMRGQSPQGFLLSDLKVTLDESHDEITSGLSTLYEAVLAVDPTLEVGVVEGGVENLKITLPVDHMIAGRLLLDADSLGGHTPTEQAPE